MNTQQSQQQTLWQQLKDKGLVTGEFKIPDKLDSPWFIKLLLAFSGWWASLFIFGFFVPAIYFTIGNGIIYLLLGFGLIAVAYKILKNKPSEFLEHLMLSFSLAGQALLAWAIFMVVDMNSALFTWLAIFVIQSILCIIIPHYIHRVCSAFFASIALAICFHYLHLSALTSASLLLLIIFLVLNEWRSVKWQPTFEAISYGLILFLIPLKGSAVTGYEFFYWFDGTQQQSWYNYLDELLILFSMLYLIIALMLRSQLHFPLGTKLVIIFATIGLCLLSMQASGVSIGFALLILGFSNSNKILQALGLTSLIFYISSYYYLLTLTLLEKAGTLLIIGLFILAIRYILLKWFNPSSVQRNVAQLPNIEKGDHHAI